MSTLRIIALTAAILPALAAAPSYAGDDPSHPAYDFEPVVLQKASGDTSSSPSSSSSASSSSSSSSPAGQEDPKYPGAFFTPKVLYP